MQKAVNKPSLSSRIIHSYWGKRLITWRWQLLFLGLCTLLVGFGIQEGFEHAQVNQFRDQSVQLPILYSYADQDLYPDDILLGARETYVTLLYPTLGILSRYIPLDLMMLSIYVLSIGMTVTGVYFIAEHLFEQRHVGMVAILLWTAWLPNLGGDFLLSPFPTHTTFAVGMQLMGLAFALRKHYALAALFIGLSANINAMTALSFAMVWGFLLLDERKTWTWHIIQIPIILGFSALPAVIWKLTSSLESSGEISTDLFVEIMRTRLWYAIFPFSVNLILWVLFGVMVAFWIYSARFAPQHTNQKIKWMSGAIILLVSIGTIFTEIIPVKLAMQLQLVRSSWVLVFFAKLYFANLLCVWLAGNKTQVNLAWLMVIMLAAPRIAFEFFPLPQPVPYEAYVDFHPDTDGVSLTEASSLALLVTVMILILWRMMHLGMLDASRRLLSLYVFAILMFTLPIFISTWVPSHQTTSTIDWQATLEWVNKNTHKDASFVTPPTFDGFRVHAQRTSFSDWKDGTLLIFNSDLAVEWITRMEYLGFNEENFSFDALTQNNLCLINATYDMDFAVVLNEWAIDGDTIYQNNTFSILEMDTLPCMST